MIVMGNVPQAIASAGNIGSSASLGNVIGWTSVQINLVASKYSGGWLAMPGGRYGVEHVNLVLLFPSTFAQRRVFPLNMLHASSFGNLRNFEDHVIYLALGNEHERHR